MQLKTSWWIWYNGSTVDLNIAVPNPKNTANDEQESKWNKSSPEVALGSCKIMSIRIQNIAVILLKDKNITIHQLIKCFL